MNNSYENNDWNIALHRLPEPEVLIKIIKHDFHKLQKEHGHKTTHKHKDKAHKQTTTGHLTFPVALHTDNDHDDEDNKYDISSPGGPLEAPTPQVFHGVQNKTVNCSQLATFTASTTL